MSHDDWFGWIQEFLEARMKDAPDDTCKMFAERQWDETAEWTEDDDE